MTRATRQTARPAARRLPGVPLTAVVALAMCALAMWVTARPAHADLVALSVGGRGGVLSAPRDAAAQEPGLAPGLGVEMSLRLLIFEAYVDHTVFGESAKLSHAILGLHLGLGTDNWRLWGRAGGGLIVDDGGVVSRMPGMPQRRTGLTARADAAVERRIVPTVWLGVGAGTEAFTLPAATGAVLPDRQNGRALFADLHLKFELGL